MTAAPKTAVAKTDGPKPDSTLETLLGLAQTPIERERAYAIAERVRQSKMIRVMADELAKLSWGNKMSEVARAQTVRYAMEIGADPLRHLYVLGDRIYLNGDFYRELVTQEADFLRSTTEWIHKDARASEEENARRLNVRIEYAVPDQVAGKDILAACVVTIYFAKRGPFTGTKWSPSNKNDPVGTEFPTLTAETRAYRRAAMKAVAPWFRTHPALERAEQLIVEGREQPRGEPAVPAVVTDGGLEPEPPKQITSEAKKPLTVKHEPSAICDEGDWHPRAECGYEHKQEREPGRD